MAEDFPKRLSLQCESLLVGSVGGRFRTQQQPGPAGEKELRFVVGTCVFLLLA